MTTMPLSIAYKMYTNTKTDDSREMFGGILLEYLYKIHRRVPHAQDEFKYQRFRGGRRQADDIVQETALQVWENLDKFDPNKSEFSTWVYNVFVNKTIDEDRQRASLRELVMLEDVHGYRPTDRVEAKLTLKKLVSALEMDDQMFVRMKLDGLSEIEIGEAFEKDAKWANNKWAYIKKSLSQVETQWVTKGPNPVALTDIKRLSPTVRSARTRDGRTVYLQTDEIKQVKVQ